VAVLQQLLLGEQALPSTAVQRSKIAVSILWLQVEESAPSVRLQLQEARSALRNISISDERYQQLKRVSNPATAQQRMQQQLQQQFHLDVGSSGGRQASLV
jgi:hypothetical protein